jgi:hypothetical protein
MNTLNEKGLESLQSMVDIANTNETYKMKFQSDTSDFTINFANPIQLNPKRSYIFGLKRFSVYNSLANVDSNNNQITISPDNGKTWMEFFIPPGAYEIKALNTRLQTLLKDKGHPDVITIEADENTSKALLSIKKSGYQVDFTKPKSLCSLLGFKPYVYKNSTNISEDLIKITLTNDIDIHCNLITSNSFVNGLNKPILNSISAYSVQVGAKIIVSEINPIFLPINTSTIDSIRFQILDDNEKLLNFSGEVVILDCNLSQV